MSNIHKIKIDDTIYTANTSFRNAIKCNQISQDKSITDIERELGIICTIFGRDGLMNQEHYDKLINWILDYLEDGEVIEQVEEPDMDYVEDMDYIEASFMSDYNIDLEESDMDWHKFKNLINGLSYSDEGNCCILNRVRNIRNIDLSTIEDAKTRQKVKDIQDKVALKKNKKEVQLTEEQESSMNALNKIIGI